MGNKTMRKRFLALLATAVFTICSASAITYVMERTIYLYDIAAAIDNECPIFYDGGLTLCHISIEDNDVIFSFSMPDDMFERWSQNKTEFGTLWVNRFNEIEDSFTCLCAESRKNMVISAFSKSSGKEFEVRFSHDNLPKIYKNKKSPAAWLRNFVYEKNKELPERVDEDTICEAIHFYEDDMVCVDYVINNKRLYAGLAEDKELTRRAFKDVIDEDEELSEITSNTKKAGVDLCFRIYFGDGWSKEYFDLKYSPSEF